MLDCAIIGDSIAVGVSKHKTHCVSIAKTGITSSRWVANNLVRIKELSSRTVLISLGSNDFGIDTARELEKIRSAITAETVYWVIPYSNTKATEAVETVCMKYCDVCVAIPQISRDKIHPTASGYKLLAELIK
jgi:lysophospholipase L1-like esterase